MELDDKIEDLSEFLHKLWSKWYKTQSDNDFQLMNEMADGDYHIANENDERWKKQSETPYQTLSEEDKEKDRKIAREILELMTKK